MDINYIECFLTVARTLNFSEAARISYISQSMVSRYIGKLEEEFGTKLFVRSNKEVELTAAGKCFFGYASEIVDNMKKARFAIEQLKSGYDGRIRIGIEAASSSFAVKCISEFSKKYPNIAVEVSELHGEEEYINDSSFDCMFLMRDMIPDNGENEYVITYEDSLSLVVPPYADAVDCTAARLREESFILLSEAENPILYMEIMDIFRTERITPKIISRPDSVRAVLVAVSAGLGVTMLPTLILKESTISSVKSAELNDIDTTLTYAAAWNRFTKNPAARLFIEIVKKYALNTEEYDLI